MGADPHSGADRALEHQGDLGEGQVVALHQVEQLHVEGEAVDPGAGEELAGHVGSEGLAAALGVAVLAEEDQGGENVEQAPAQPTHE
jgi:hypothetical protein